MDNIGFLCQLNIGELQKIHRIASSIIPAFTVVTRRGTSYETINSQPGITLFFWLSLFSF